MKFNPASYFITLTALGAAIFLLCSYKPKTANISTQTIVKNCRDFSEASDFINSNKNYGYSVKIAVTDGNSRCLVIMEKN